MKLKTISYLLFCFICIEFTSCENSDKNSKQSNSNHQDSILLKQYLINANLFIEKNNADSARYFASKIFDLATKNKNNYYLGKSHAIHGYLNLIQSNNEAAYFHLNHAKDHFIKINDSLNSAKNLTNMAIIQANLGDYSGSELTATEALKLIQNQKNVNFKSSIYNSLAITSGTQDNYNEAIYWYKKAIEAESDLYGQAMYKNNLAVSYQSLKNYNQANLYLSELLKDSIVQKNPDLLSKVIDNLAYSKWKQNPEMNVEKELNEALKIRSSNQDKLGQIASNAHFSEYFAAKNPATALTFAHEMYRLAVELESPDDQLEALQKLIALESPENSKQYALVYSNLNERLVKERNRAKDQFAKIRYDSEKNREENEILRAETAEQQLEIERRKLYVILSFSGIVLVFGGFLAFQRIQKIKNQKRINDEIHATENKIAGKVHDDIANNVYGLISFIEGNNEVLNAEKQNIVIEKLDEIYQLSRNISRENSPIETGEKYPDELLNLFSNYKNDSTNVVLIGFVEEPWLLINSEIKIQFYKVVQELLTNMKKHSEASLVVLNFKFEENKFDFFYTDNGVGLSENQQHKKNGIQITENRIEKIKGTISFAGEPNKGLKVNIAIPI